MPVISRVWAADQMQQLYKLLVEKDATMVEINPMVEVIKEGKRRGRSLLY